MNPFIESVWDSNILIRPPRYLVRGDAKFSLTNLKSKYNMHHVTQWRVYISSLCDVFVYKSHLDIVSACYVYCVHCKYYLFVSPLQCNSIVCSFIKRIVHILQQMEEEHYYIHTYHNISARNNRCGWRIGVGAICVYSVYSANLTNF